MMNRHESSLYEMSLGQVLSQYGADVHPAILWDDLCGLVCPECPLRPWKSSLSRTHCLDVLKVIKQDQRTEPSTTTAGQDGMNH